MRDPDLSKYLERHELMLRYQQSINPFPATVKELMVVWGVRSTSVVGYCLARLVRLGLVKRRRKHGRSQYYAIRTTPPKESLTKPEAE